MERLNYHPNPNFRGANALAAAITPAKPRSPCAHLGKPTGETIPCDTCAGKVMLKVLECEVFGTCTVGKPVDGKACCVGCKKWEPIRSSE